MSMPLMLLALAAAVPGAVTSSDIAAPGPKGELRGTLLHVEGSTQPTVLMLPGSGPTDRDGNSSLGMKASTYRLLAEGLAQHGIASVRIDKRGLLASAGAVEDGNAVTLQDYVQDTHAWIRATRARTGATCVWLLGHSEGGLIALATVAGGGDEICGLILVATAGRPLGQVLKQQLHDNPNNAALLPDADRAIDTLSAGQRVDASKLPPPLMALFRPETQGWFISEMAVDPARLIGKLHLPVMIVQGEKDLQVSVEDAQRLKSALPSAQLDLLPDANHMLKSVTGEGRAANFATYVDPNLPLAPHVVEGIAGFIASGR
ncbi:alpha/beta hydrolase [Novosphingobium terrae]|uniref:alpha/beta hydrolase n=1 Tax=Novosphingobium terrae TaxID=2726189 RepID=UPI002AC3484A|nr:alpha/beta fold hydrolase [Novosphingobium terrae]